MAKDYTVGAPRLNHSLGDLLTDKLPSQAFLAGVTRLKPRHEKMFGIPRVIKPSRGFESLDVAETAQEDPAAEALDYGMESSAFIMPRP